VIVELPLRVFTGKDDKSGRPAVHSLGMNVACAGPDELVNVHTIMKEVFGAFISAGKAFVNVVEGEWESELTDFDAAPGPVGDSKIPCDLGSGTLDFIEPPGCGEFFKKRELIFERHRVWRKIETVHPVCAVVAADYPRVVGIGSSTEKDAARKIGLGDFFAHFKDWANELKLLGSFGDRRFGNPKLLDSASLAKLHGDQRSRELSRFEFEILHSMRRLPLACNVCPGIEQGLFKKIGLGA
jgi:hypothetical protein